MNSNSCRPSGGSWIRRSTRPSRSRRLCCDKLICKRRRHLHLLAFWPVVDLAFAVVVLFVSGSCLGDHWSTPSLALPSAALLIAAIVFVIGNLRQLANVGGIIWDGPIGSIQVAMSRLRRARIQQFKWAVLSGPLVWFCGMCVGGQCFSA